MYNNESLVQSYGISSYMRTHNLPVTAHLHCVTFHEIVTIKGLAIDTNCQFCICAFPHFCILCIVCTSAETTGNNYGTAMLQLLTAILMPTVHTPVYGCASKTAVCIVSHCLAIQCVKLQ